MEKNVVTPSLASFSFNSYIIEECELKQTGNTLSKEMQFAIKPQGELVEADRLFILSLQVAVKDKEENFSAKLKIKGRFTYETSDNKTLLDFICANAPAIIFPYIRAYISTLSSLSGVSTIIMPTINMIQVGKALREQMQPILSK